MDSKYVTVSSSTQNPSSFISNFAQNVNFEDGFEIALKSIYHAMKILTMKITCEILLMEVIILVY